MEKKIFIILLNYKGVEDTLEAVKSLEEITYSNYEIVIVDNESPDDSFERLKSELGDKHHVIPSGKNGGFAYGNNIGIKYALDKGADYVLLINNDTTVEKDFLNHLVETFNKEENIGLTTGLILNYYNKDKIWFDGGEIKRDKFYGYHINEGKSFNEIKTFARKITFATGCLMLIKREVIEKIGGLPEEYFMYYEDVDFCMKLQQEGYSIYYNPDAIIYHKISAASGEEESPFAIEWNTRNRLKFAEKYKGSISNISYIKFKNYFYITRTIKIVQYVSKKRMDKCKALVKGIKNR